MMSWLDTNSPAEEKRKEIQLIFLPKVFTFRIVDTLKLLYSGSIIIIMDFSLQRESLYMISLQLSILVKLVNLEISWKKKINREQMTLLLHFMRRKSRTYHFQMKIFFSMKYIIWWMVIQYTYPWFYIDYK